MKVYCKKKFLSSIISVLILNNVNASHTKELHCSSWFDQAPLSCSSFDLQLHGGVAPIIWRNKGDFFAIDCPALAQFPLRRIFSFPKFGFFFHVPWTIGGQLGYQYSDALRFYFDFNYLQARSKSEDKTQILLGAGPSIIPGTLVNFSLKNNYRLFDCYIGTQYYVNWWFDCTALYIGAKVGLTQRQKVGFSLVATVPGLNPPLVIVPEDSNVSLLRKNTCISGGLNVGVDFCICNNIDIMICAELVASCGPKVNNNIIVMPNFPIPTRDLLINPIGTELRFPITAALRYSF